MKLEIRWILWSNLKTMREKGMEIVTGIPNSQILYFVVTSAGCHYPFSCENLWITVLICEEKLFIGYFCLIILVWILSLFAVWGGFFFCFLPIAG